MPAVVRRLNESRLPELVMACISGDPRVLHAPAALGSLPGNAQIQRRGRTMRVDSRRSEASLCGFLMVILNCQRLLLAKISGFPTYNRSDRSRGSPKSGALGEGETADLPLFRRTLVPEASEPATVGQPALPARTQKG